MALTRSPGRTRVTLFAGVPTAITPPAPSEQGMIGSLSFGLYLPWTVSRSRKLSEAARSRTSAWPGPGTGSGRSTIAIWSRLNPRISTARTASALQRFLDLLLELAGRAVRQLLRGPAHPQPVVAEFGD